MSRASWCERYLISISEFISIKGIMLLRDCGQTAASKIRQEAIKYCITNNIEIYGRNIPTEAVLIVTNRDIEYYYGKMLLERQGA